MNSDTEIFARRAKVNASNLKIEPELKAFLENWDNEYKNKMKDIPIFNQDLTSRWNNKQKQLFVKILYHLRGHFDDFLWHMGCFAPDYKTKEMIIDNIRDEFGKHGFSHEKLFLNFAESVGVDLTYELLEETAYVPFAREYIKGQLKWLREHNWDHKLAAFAAVERLDNVDYINLRNIAVSIGATKKDLVFFNVHITAKHFEGILAIAFHELWNKNQTIPKNVFTFISDYQTKMWRDLSNAVFNEDKYLC